MSWSIEAAGTPAAVREQVRRHAHHYWRPWLGERELGVIQHVLGHALARFGADDVVILTGSGQDAAGVFEVHLHVRRVPLAPPVPTRPAPDAPA